MPASRRSSIRTSRSRRTPRFFESPLTKEPRRAVLSGTRWTVYGSLPKMQRARPNLGRPSSCIARAARTPSTPTTRNVPVAVWGLRLEHSRGQTRRFVFYSPNDLHSVLARRVHALRLRSVEAPHRCPRGPSPQAPTPTSRRGREATSASAVWVAEHEDERGERTHTAADPERAEAAPVHLSDFARQRREAR
jgi:hypothetical protein